MAGNWRRSAVLPAHRVMTEGIGLGILKGEFKVGELLPSPEELAERFGVSRTVQREAFKTLAAKGLVASKTKIGTWVLPPKSWNMFDADLLEWRVRLGMDGPFIASLFEVRRALEPEAAGLAALRRTEAQLDHLRQIIAAMAACIDPERYIDLDLSFHLDVTEASGNPFLQSLGGLIEAALAAAFTRSTPPRDVDELHYSAGQHAEIFQAIERGDVLAAKAAMTRVIDTGAVNARREQAR